MRVRGQGEVGAKERKFTSMNWPPRIRGSAQPISTLGVSTLKFEGRKGVCVFQAGKLKGNGIARAGESRARRESMVMVGI